MQGYIEPKILDFFLGIQKGDRVTLGRVLTLIESNLEEDRKKSEALLALCLSNKRDESLRVGITGVPGVGKSTFIENFSLELIHKYNRKVAVLAIDPSSQITKGSILGDKTRMPKLALEANAFIRPSPSSGREGGVSFRTRESILIFEAAGFNTILIETVGVGQSELDVSTMSDLLLVLMLAGGGDHLQGLKKGIMEYADLIVITKADQENITHAKISQKEYEMAISHQRKRDNHWNPRVLTCSAIQKKGLDEIWETLSEFVTLTQKNKSFYKKRKEQIKIWVHDRLKEEMQVHLKRKFEDFEKDKEYEAILEELMQGKIHISNLSQKIFSLAPKEM